MIKLPHDAETEKALLGALLLDPGKLHIAEDILKTESAFHSIRHRRIYKAINDLLERKMAIDLVTVHDELNKGAGEKIDGSFLTSLLDMAPTPELVEQYANSIREKAIRRQLYSVCAEGAKIALNEGAGDVQDALSQVGQQLNNLAQQSNRMCDSSIIQLTYERWEKYIDEEGKEPDWIKTGFFDLDKLIGGFMPGEHVVIGARPSMGKTSFGLNLCINAARASKRVLFFTMEMSRGRVIDRLIAMESMVNLSSFLRRQLTEEEKAKIYNRIVGIAHRRIGVIDGSWGVSEIRSRVLQEKRTHGVDMVVIDFLTLLKPPREGSDLGHESVGENAKRLELLAVEAGIPIVTLAQLSRKVEDRNNKRPILRDLRESGGIEEYSDKVMYIYRDDYYNANTKEPGVAEIIVAKNRDGPTGTVKLAWQGHSATFKNLLR